jgi:dipeptidyl aminopeptidase/acylaminoacyl peptidase
MPKEGIRENVMAVNQTDSNLNSNSLPPLIPRKVLFGNPEKTGPQISPDGSNLAYLAPKDGVLNVWVRTLGQDNDRAVTSDALRGIRQFYWQGDSAHLLYLQDTGGDENFHVYQTKIASGETRDLTPFPGARALPLALNPNHPDEMLVSVNNRDPQVFDVYRFSFETGTLALDTENPGDVSGFSADNAMQVRTAQTQLPDGSTELRVRDGEGWRVFLTWGADETNGGVAGFSPDNSQMWLINSVDANASRLLQVDLATAASTVIAEDPEYDVSDLLRHPRTRALQAVAFTRARTEWTALDPALEADFEALSRASDGDWNIVSRDLADTTWIVSYLRDNGPVSYFAYDRAAKTASFLFTSKPDLDSYTLARMEPVTFPARDGLTLHGYLTLPIGLKLTHLPLVLLVHGGPWSRDMWGYSGFVQWLANRGYAVLQINFRGSTGYGKAFLNAGDREWGAKMHTDLLDGKAWAIAEGYADPEKVAIMGGSYGGYATLAGLAFTPEEFVCGVDIVGPSNLLTLLQTIPPYWSTLVATFFKRMGRLDEPDFLKARSPLFSADKITKPLLIAQGANDPRVKQAESDQIVEAMRAGGLPVEYMVFPDEGHGFARPENNLKFTAAAESFLAKYLGGRAEPPSPEESSKEFQK